MCFKLWVFPEFVVIVLLGAKSIGSTEGAVFSCVNKNVILLNSKMKLIHYTKIGIFLEL